MRIIPLLCLVLASAALAAAQGKTYFVDAANGSDTNNGLSRKAAFKSITKASKVVADDDTVIVLPGTYSPSKTNEQYPIQFGDSGKPTKQRRIELFAEGGPAVTILDGENQMTSAGKPIMRFRWDGGGKVTGFTFQNTGSQSFWSMCIRLGSTSGGNFAAQDVEVHGCVFRNVHRAIVVFGTNPQNTNQTTGIRIHDNLIVDTTSEALALWGHGDNAAYDNTIVNSSVNGIYVDSLWDPSSKALIANNIVFNGKGNGITAGDNGGNARGKTATYANNTAFKNAQDYKGPAGFSFPKTNNSVDPQFVDASKGDYHLKATSPLIGTGTANLPILRHDNERLSRLYDANGDGTAAIDRGAFEFARESMALTGTFTTGQTVTYRFKSSTPGAAFVLLGLSEGALEIQPFGVFAIGLAGLAPEPLSTTSPGNRAVTIPSNPSLLGATIVSQGGYLSGSRAHLLNVEKRIL